MRSSTGNKEIILNYDEFIDVCRKMVKSNTEWDHNANVMADDQFALISQFRKPKSSWFHSWSDELFIFAFIAVLALTGKMAAENYWKIQKESQEQSKAYAGVNQ